MNVEPLNMTDFRLTSQYRTDVDPLSFKDSMAAFASAVCVVSAGARGEWLGRTATAVMSLTISPPALLVSIDQGSALSRLIFQTGGFSVAALSATQQVIADAFAGRVPSERRFRVGRWDRWPSGRPRLAGAVWTMDCTLIGTADIGSHLLFAGGVSVLDVYDERPPLIWHARSYSSLPPPEVVRNFQVNG